ncbi:MAG: hypothetical protein HZB39_18265 [Planctomycetes bacterium]|nr:hypothetical protein [Planctomycetota bacterium]
MNALRIGSVLLAACLLAGCELVPRGDARIGWFPGKLSGDIALDSSAGGLNLDLVRTDVNDDLGLSRSGAATMGADLDTELGRVSVSYLRYSDNATGSLSRAFGDIPPGTNVETTIDIDNLKAFWTFDLLANDTFRVSPGVGVDLFWFDATVRSITALSAYENLEVDVPMPMLFLEGEVDLGAVKAEIEAGWMSLDVGEFDGNFVDLDARVRYTGLSALELFGGYRWIALDVDGKADNQRFDANLDLSGFYFGGGVHFGAARREGSATLARM